MLLEILLQGDQNCCLGVCHMKTTPFVKKNLAGYLKTPKVTRISGMYTNFSHPPMHSGPSKLLEHLNYGGIIIMDNIKTFINFPL